ncbi:MAG: hypothetical protein O2895_07275 [Chloroflexi bacterium]|nr:hypothetical protein [Chloroflexota bacterium]
MSKDAAQQPLAGRVSEAAPGRRASEGPEGATPESLDDERVAAEVAREQRLGNPSPTLPPGQLLALQRTLGNRTVNGMMASRGASAIAAALTVQRSAAEQAPPLALQHHIQRHIGPTLPEEIEPGTGTGSAGGGLDYVQIARRIQNAIEGLGTDEDAIYAALGQLGQDAAKIAALQFAYQALTSRALDADLVDDLSGDELARAQRLLRPPDRRQQIETLLGTTDTGRWALGIIQRWSIPVDYEFSGTGSFHRAGSIFINQTLSVDAAAIVMMHEAQHAMTFKSGAAADVMGLTRDAYVQAKIADEAEAVVRQIEGSVPMQAAGSSLLGSGMNQGLIDRYRTAFYVYRDALEVSDPEMTRAEINVRCRTQTRDNEVTSWFHDGTFVTSTGNITYSAHYGGAWDRAHNPPSPAAP